MGQGSGYKKKKHNKKIEVKTRISSSGGESSDEGISLDCLPPFALENPTKLVKETNVGEQIFGDDSNDRILIFSQIGALGYVPKKISAEIIEISKRKKSSVLGIIVEKLGDENVVVEICL